MRWLQQQFPSYFQVDGVPIPLAPHHEEFWRWLWNLRPGIQVPAFIGVWPRGGGKSTSVELGCAALAYFGMRRYGGYLCETQDQADEHVENIGTLLLDLGLDRAVTKYGYSRGWRANRLRTQEGFILVAFGLDKSARGMKKEDMRFDILFLDDLDDDDDTPLATQKKILRLTRKILPMGTASTAIIGVQNMPNPDGIFAQLVDGRADFLMDRVISGPHPALRDFDYERIEQEDGGSRVHITHGKPVWQGQSLEACQVIIDRDGLQSFLVECLHQQASSEGTFFQDYWKPSVHVILPFLLPDTWLVNRAHDWGSARPYCTLWFAESNGESVQIGGMQRSFPPGTVFVIAEDYGTGGDQRQGWNVGLRLTARQIAQRIVREEALHNWGSRVLNGPGDDPLFDAGRHGYSMADEMAEEGVWWEKPQKGPGSRITGWQLICERLQASRQQPMEYPGLFVFNICRHLIRTLPLLQADKKKIEDIDTENEDHAADCLRLRILAGSPVQGGFVTMRGH
jgi:hypothetical protein